MGSCQQEHRYFGGIDSRAGRIYVRINRHKGKTVLRTGFPLMHDIVVGVESLLRWYRLDSLCAENHILFVLGHALYMKTLHGGKIKNDKTDASHLLLADYSIRMIHELLGTAM